MKILFIKPPNRGLYHETVRFIPIGLAYLASACRMEGHEVLLFDSLTYFEDNRVLYKNELTDIQRRKISLHPVIKHIIHWGASYERIKQKLLECQPDVVCITSMHSPSYETAYDIAKLVAQELPNAVTVIGGSHASISYEHILEFTNIDYIIQAEGEKSLPKLLNCIENNIIPKDVDGIVFKTIDPQLANKKTATGVTYYYSAKKEWIHNLDDNIYPAADLLNFDKYDATSVLITSRGCPFSCSFCTVHPTVGKTFRCRSAENIVNEIEWYINNFNIQKFNIEDDNFTFNIERVTAICDLIIARGLDIELYLHNGIMVLGITEMLVDKMLKAGIMFLFFGLETTFNEKLKNLKKEHTSLSKVKEALGWFKKRDATMGASLIIGLPDQTLDDIISDIVCLIENDIEFGSPNPFYPIPGSEIYDTCVQSGLINPNEDLTWFCEFNFPIETKHFNRRDIYDLWSVCNAFFIWPQALLAYRQKIPFEERIKFIENDHTLRGKITSRQKSFYFIPDKGISYSEINRISPHNDNAELFIDSVTGDMIANMAYLLTGQPHKSIQIQSVLNNDPVNSFCVYPHENSRSRAIEKLVQELTLLYMKNGGKQNENL